MYFNQIKDLTESSFVKPNSRQIKNLRHNTKQGQKCDLKKEKLRKKNELRRMILTFEKHDII